MRLKNYPNRQLFTGSCVLVVFFVAIFVLLSQNPGEVKNIEIKHAEIAQVTLDLDLAVTPLEQAQGLSGRTSIKDNEGMLFIFDKTEKHGFWMKDMNFPIDIIWLGEDFRVIYIQKNALPKSYPQIFGDKVDSMYVLEVVAGFSEKNNLVVGDKVKFTR